MHGLMGWASGGSEWEGEKKEKDKKKRPSCITAHRARTTSPGGEAIHARPKPGKPQRPQ